MKKLLTSIGKKSKKAFLRQINTKKKNKVLKDYCLNIKKNKKLIINENKKDVTIAKKKGLKDNLFQTYQVLEEKGIVPMGETAILNEFLSEL